MAVRSTMAALIARTRQLINDPSGASQVFTDQEIQDVLDESRFDVYNMPLTPKPTYSGSTISFLDYFSEQGNWEDDYVLKQYLTVTVSPSTVEPIAGHFHFSGSTLPPVFLTGKRYDVFRASADLLERWAAKLVLAYDATADGQTLKRSQMATALLNLAKQYRMKQQPCTISLLRSDLKASKNSTQASGLGAFGPDELSLAPTELDYMAGG